MKQLFRHTGHTIEETVAAADAYRANADKIGEHVVRFFDFRADGFTSSPSKRLPDRSVLVWRAS
jgi:hypothetical protein